MIEFAKSIRRSVRRSFRNWNLRRLCEGLYLGSHVEISGSRLSRNNIICDHSTVTDSELGDYSYLGVNGRISRASIGKFCSIGPDVIISPGMHPSDTFVSTHPIFYSMTFKCHERFAQEQRFVETGKVSIGHDVWIGARAVILENVKIGTGAIIAAGAVVNRDVEPYSIVGGLPAKHIKYRFEPKQIAKLLESEWWNESDDFFKKNVSRFYDIAKFESYLEEHNNG